MLFVLYRSSYGKSTLLNFFFGGEYGNEIIFRSMQPGDANIAGNVHGGSILKLIEEAGLIVSTRHCNIGNKSNVSIVDKYIITNYKKVK